MCVIMLSVIMLSVIMLSVIMLCVIMLCVIMLSVIMLNVIMLTFHYRTVNILSVLMLVVVMLSATMLGVVILSVISHRLERKCFVAFAPRNFMGFAGSQMTIKFQIKLRPISIENFGLGKFHKTLLAVTIS
jgi:hypothetical protein